MPKINCLSPVKEIIKKRPRGKRGPYKKPGIESELFATPNNFGDFLISPVKVWSAYLEYL